MNNNALPEITGERLMTLDELKKNPLVAIPPTLLVLLVSVLGIVFVCLSFKMFGDSDSGSLRFVDQIDVAIKDMKKSAKLHGDPDKQLQILKGFSAELTKLESKVQEAQDLANKAIYGVWFWRFLTVLTSLIAFLSSLYAAVVFLKPE
jgi:hypothetical protein